MNNFTVHSTTSQQLRNKYGEFKQALFINKCIERSSSLKKQKNKNTHPPTQSYLLK